MNKYPLDDEGIESITKDLLQSHLAQQKTIEKLSNQLSKAISYIENDEWYEETTTLIKNIHVRNIDFANLRFNQQNGYKTEEISPYLEGGHDTPMTEEELAKHFGEVLPKKKKVQDVSKMTLEEITEWESKQENSNDIYKVAARIKNLARDGKANLTPVGEMLCNTFVHVLKSFYDFAETISDKEIKIKLIELTRKQEAMPGNFIAAAHSGVKD